MIEIECLKSQIKLLVRAYYSIDFQKYCHTSDIVDNRIVFLPFLGGSSYYGITCLLR